MKTVGQIIRFARLDRNLSLEQLSQLTRIDTKYITALESDHYDLLPSETFAKGFIRNIGNRLGKNSNELVAIFRRDYRSTNTPPKHFSSLYRSKSFPRFAYSSSLPIIAGTVVFLLYLVFQFRVFLTPPALTVDTPVSGAVITSPIEISGQTALDSVVYFGTDSSARPDETGHFSGRLSFPIGETVLEVKSVNRFSRITTKKIPLTIVSK